MSTAASLILGGLFAVVSAGTPSARPSASSQPPLAPQVESVSAIAGSLPKREPFRQLVPLSGLRQRRDEATHLPTKPREPEIKVVCGMTVYRVPSDIDAKMVIKSPQQSGTSFAIRRIAPSTCAEDAIPLSK